MKTILAVLLLTGLALGQNPQPSLSDTVSFMNRALEQDNAGLIENNGCEVTLTRYLLGDVLNPVGLKKVEGSYRIGIPDRYEYTYGIIRPAEHLRSDFNLKDIDPDSIRADEYFNVKTIADRPDKFDLNLPPRDCSIVKFKTSNLIKAIHATDFVDRSTLKEAKEKAETSGVGEFGVLLEPGTKNLLAKDMTFDLLLMQNRDSAARFTKAFKHAVELCGGKPSAF